MKKLLNIFLITIFLVFSLLSCSKVENPYASDIQLPKANIQIFISSLIVDYDLDSAFWSWSFNIELKETGNVLVVIHELKIQTFLGGSFIEEVNHLSIGSVPASQSLTFPCVFFTDNEIDSFSISIKGTDSNGHAVTASQTFT